MSSGELDRVAVMGRVASGGLRLSSAAEVLGLSYRQAKRLWRRCRQGGGEGLKHGNAGRPSDRGKPTKLRRRVLALVRKKYSGSEEERFGPTLAAEHLAEEDGVVVDHETRCCTASALPRTARTGRTRQDLIMDAKGNLYGTTYSGGIYGNGTVFMITP